MGEFPAGITDPEGYVTCALPAFQLRNDPLLWGVYSDSKLPKHNCQNTAHRKPILCGVRFNSTCCVANYTAYPYICVIRYSSYGSINGLYLILYLKLVNKKSCTWATSTMLFTDIW